MNWWRRLVKRGEMERHLDAELRFHFDGLVADNLRAGMSEPEARRSARLEFGGVEQVKEECRDARGTRWIEDLWQDLHFALRTLRKTPGFAIAVIGTLALGIGMNTAVFSVIHAVLLRPLDFSDPDRLVYFSTDNAQLNVHDGTFTLIRFEEMTASARSFAGLGAFLGSTEEMTLSGDGEPEQLKGARVSANFLSVLGVQPILGRSFRPEEDTSGSPRVAMISESLWKRRFNGDPQIIGKPIALDATPYEIAGVLPEGFEFPLTGADVWVPRPSEWSAFPARYWRNVSMLSGFGRLKPGVTLEQARAEMDVLNQQYIRAHPANATERGSSMRVVWLKDRLVSNVRSLLWMLFGAAGFVLLIGCANVASLMLARATARAHEFASRAALGAARARLIRQLLTESLVLTIAGGLIGLLLARWGLRAITLMDALSLATRVRPVYLPGSRVLELNGLVLAFTVVVSITTGILFGLFPSLQASRPDLARAMRESGSGTSPKFGRRKMLDVGFHGLLVAGQVAFSIVLLIGAALMMASFSRLHSVNPGFQNANLLTMKIALPLARYDTERKKTVFFEDLAQHVEVLPGVRDAAIAMSIPTTRWIKTNITSIEGKPAQEPDHPSAYAVIQSVTPNYFRTLGIPLRRGREFAARDYAPGATPAMIINETMARRFWPNYPDGQDDPVGMHIGEGYDKLRGPMEVVGVVADIHEGGLGYDGVPEFYLPTAVHPPQSAYLVVRTWGNPLGLVNSVRGQVLEMDRDQPISDVKTMDDVLEATLSDRRLTMLLLGLYAGAALLLSAIGIYGLMAYSVQQRTKEVGIRIALGAEPHTVRNAVLLRGMRLALIGVAIGIAAALGLTRLLAGLLFGVQPRDPFIFMTVPVFLIVVALLACYLPARRATRINPLEALRWE
jgi:putative ABC transport system permease protein